MDKITELIKTCKGRFDCEKCPKKTECETFKKTIKKIEIPADMTFLIEAFKE